MIPVFESPREFIGKEGAKFGPTQWVTVEQDRIDQFAEATGDHQWIHVDVTRAKDSPFGGTIAHGYLTLSMVNLFLPDLLEVRGFTHAVNVGADRLRFLSPVKSGSRIRATSEVISAEEVKGAIQAVVRVVIEIEGSEKPALTVDTISRYFPE